MSSSKRDKGGKLNLFAVKHCTSTIRISKEEFLFDRGHSVCADQ